MWNDEHGLHLWQGRALTAGEFNAFASSREWDRLVDLHGGLLQIRVVEDAVSPPSVAAATGDGVAPPQPKTRRTPAKKPKKRRSAKKKPRTAAKP